jgi:glycosyltransferase involved in cell wall biosynthesis
MRFVARGPETWFEEAFRTQAVRTTVISSALAERARNLGVSENSILLIPQGCDIGSIAPVKVAEARLRCGLTQDVPIVGYEGTLLKDDGPLLIRAFEALREADDRIQLLLIGRPQFNLPDMPGLVRTGFVPRDRLADYLGACDVLLLPLADTIANRGRWPSKLNDYLAAGRSTVATPVGDLRQLFARHDIGLLGHLNDGSFIAACLELLADPTRRATFEQNARALAETDLSWSTICEGLVTVYREALRGAVEH